MYHLPEFKEPSREKVIAFMKAHPFAMIIGCADNRPVATQIPLLLEERDGKLFLLGHMMRKQDHHLAFEKNPETLVLFTGAHTYVSATLYTNPQQGSTWNYMTVHARGAMNFTDRDGLLDIMQRLTLYFEENNTHSPTVFNNLSEDYKNKMLKSIIGFEIEVRELQHVFKLSQNRDQQSFHNIMTHLQAQEGDGKIIAGEMQQRASQLFNGQPE